MESANANLHRTCDFASRALAGNRPWRRYSMSIPLFIRSAATRLEGLWFDATRHVQTSSPVSLHQLTLVGAEKIGGDYLPTRPTVARQILALLPIQNHSEYTFIDLGSGKGRMLLIAAEYPFRKVQGLEIALELHREAKQNISRYHHPSQRCAIIESINLDALEYVFPDGNLILYLFNPFLPEVLKKVLANLESSLAQHPRHVMVIIVNPVFGFVIEEKPFLRLYLETRRFRIYQSANT